MKTVVITGASRGIGLATATKFLAHGWRVIGTYLNTAMPISDENLIAVQMDQGDPDSIKRAVAQIKNERIDALVNNAGIIVDGHDEGADLAKIRKTFDVDLFGVIDLTEQLLPLMPEGSHIVNIDSQYGSFSYPVDDATSTGYRLAKAALNMHTRALAFRQPRHIVSSLDPGWVATDMGNDGATETERPDRQPHQPADDIYTLVTTVQESGKFWRFGKVRQW